MIQKNKKESLGINDQCYSLTPGIGSENTAYPGSESENNVNDKLFQIEGDKEISLPAVDDAFLSNESPNVQTEYLGRELDQPREGAGDSGQRVGQDNQSVSESGAYNIAKESGGELKDGIITPTDYVERIGYLREQLRQAESEKNG